MLCPMANGMYGREELSPVICLFLSDGDALCRVPVIPGARGGGGAQGLGIRLFAFGSAYWPLTTAHSDPLWVRKCFGCVGGGGGRSGERPPPRPPSSYGCQPQRQEIMVLS